MPVEFTVRLRCEACGATIRYTNERPPWQTDEERARELTEARIWLIEQQGSTIYSRPAQTEWPKYVRRGGLGSMQLYVLPVLPEYVPCPSCSDRVYRNQHDTSAEDEPLTRRGYVCDVEGCPERWENYEDAPCLIDGWPHCAKHGEEQRRIVRTS